MNESSKRSSFEKFRKALERVARGITQREEEPVQPAAEAAGNETSDAPAGSRDSRSLAEEVREVQEGRRRRAESAAIRSSEDIEDVLAKTYAAAAERRSEERAEYLLASDPIEETPLGVETGEDAPEIEVRRDPA